jgi:hypothetical protein
MMQLPGPRDASLLTKDDYRAAKIVVDYYGERAERQALAHINHLAGTRDHPGVTRWEGILAAIQELQQMAPMTWVLH